MSKAEIERDFIDLADRIRKTVLSRPDKGKVKLEFASQLQTFIRLYKFYPKEANRPWDELGHICRMYLQPTDGIYTQWQVEALNLLRGID